MPLIIEGATLEAVPCSLGDLLKQHPHLKEAASQISSSETRQVAAGGLLYVLQREVATVSPDDEYIHVLGTEDATTCHIAILRHTGSGVTSLTHLDGRGTAAALQHMLKSVMQQSRGKPDGRLDLYLAGGFIDNRQESIKLTKQILGELIQAPEEIHLVQACITDLNDCIKNGLHFPKIYGMGVDVRKGEIFCAEFPDKGPDIDIRSACHFTGSSKQVADIYEGNGVLAVGPYSWEPWEDIDMWVNLPDHVYRKYLSTSPEQEPAHFEAQVREALRVIQQHPYPASSLFPTNQPRRYKIQENGSWTKL